MPAVPSPRASTFGPLKDKHYVERAMIHWLAKALPTWMSEVERVLHAYGAFDGIPGIDVSQIDNAAGLLTRPQAYASRTDLASFPDDKLPLVLALCPGTLGEPVKRGGMYDATWALSAAFIVQSSDFYATDIIASAYELAIRACILQHGSLDQDDITIRKWIGSSFNELPVERTRQLRAVIVSFSVLVTDVVDVTKGPLEVDPDLDHTDRILTNYAETVDIELNRQEL